MLTVTVDALYCIVVLLCCRSHIIPEGYRNDVRANYVHKSSILFLHSYLVFYHASLSLGKLALPKCASIYLIQTSVVYIDGYETVLLVSILTSLQPYSVTRRGLSAHKTDLTFQPGANIPVQQYRSR